VLGLRFKAMSLDSPPTRRAHAARPLNAAQRSEGEHGSAGGCGGGEGVGGGERWTVRPVEILPCHGSLYGQMFIVFVFFTAWMEANGMSLNLDSESAGTCQEVGATDSEFGKGVTIGDLLQGLQGMQGR
jgi:hypothetical protein